MILDAEFKKVQFGCGLSHKAGWVNYDSSLTLKLQRLPVLGAIARKAVPPLFDECVRFGDVSKGLPIPDGSVQFLYSSHVLEHIPLLNLRRALVEAFRVLAPGGIFRSVMPDLERLARSYLSDERPEAAVSFIEYTGMGLRERPKGLMGGARFLWGNSRHVWLWDQKGIAAELDRVGFSDIRRAVIGDSAAQEFSEVEEESRWSNALGFECRKPLS